jgi:hypothetical protein
MFSVKEQERRRERFERELNLYACFAHHLEDQPPYMPELRALYMAVRETYKGGMGKGQTIDHMWDKRVGVPRKRRR